MEHKILLVMSSERRKRLADFLSSEGLDVLPVDSAGKAMRILAERRRYDLVFVEAELRDGTWRDLIPAALFSKTPCEMIVCTRLGEEHLWAEVLQCGAYDLIEEPYEQPATLRIIESAMENHYMQRLREELRPC